MPLKKKRAKSVTSRDVELAAENALTTVAMWRIFHGVSASTPNEIRRSKSVIASLRRETDLRRQRLLQMPPSLIRERMLTIIEDFDSECADLERLCDASAQGATTHRWH